MGLKILIAPDKFKGSLSAQSICKLLMHSIQDVMKDAQFELCPLADGGDGSLEILAEYLNIEKQFCESIDPLGRPINSEYYIYKDTAYIELASASGLVLLQNEDRNPMYTSTVGTGLLIQDAIQNGVKHIYLFLGGSATNDGGTGIASALGYKFLDQNGTVLSPTGESLDKIFKIEAPIEEIGLKSITLCCDVSNPPTGENGAAFVYGMQKGANEIQIKILDNGLRNLCASIKDFNNIDLLQLQGGGAAGGVAISLVSLFNATIVKGMELISDVVKLESKIENSDLVISGEGALDESSLQGKVVSGVAALCRKYNKKLCLVVGKNELQDGALFKLGIDKVYSIIEKAKDLEDAMVNSAYYLKKIGNEIGLDNLDNK